MAYTQPIIPGNSFGTVQVPTAPGRGESKEDWQKDLDKKGIPYDESGPLPSTEGTGDEEKQLEDFYNLVSSQRDQAMSQARYLDQQMKLLPPGDPKRIEIQAQLKWEMKAFSDLSAVSATKGAKDKEGKDKFGLTELSLLVLALGAGVQVAESIEEMINGDDIDNIDVREELRKNTEAITDPVVRQKIIDASYGDQGALNDLENLSTYNNQFGSLSSDMFNGPNGQELEGQYQKFLETNPGIDRDQFLVEFARTNPTNPISQDINRKLSRMGQVTRGASEWGEIERKSILEGMQDAGKFYKPTNQGGYGFTPDQFRSDEQNQVVDHAMGLVNSPEARLLKQNAYERVQTGGELGRDALREITGNALTAVDPSLQAQPYLRGGGLANSVLNTELAQRKRLMEDEQALFGIVQGERNYAPALSGVVNTNTVDPVNAMGLSGKNSSANANNAYNTAPATGLNYDPTSGYMGAVTAQNANINQANKLQPSTGENISNVGSNIDDLNKALEGLGI